MTITSLGAFCCPSHGSLRTRAVMTADSNTFPRYARNATMECVFVDSRDGLRSGA